MSWNSQDFARKGLGQFDFLCLDCTGGAIQTRVRQFPKSPAPTRSPVRPKLETKWGLPSTSSRPLEVGTAGRGGGEWQALGLPVSKPDPDVPTLPYLARGCTPPHGRWTACAPDPYAGYRTLS